jgi:IS605 OrfB family transposase
MLAQIAGDRLGQFLTAVFEMRPTRRKAAVMERVRQTAEDVFWAVLSPGNITAAEQAIATDDRAERRKLLSGYERATLAEAARAGLCEPVAQGLARDVVMAVSSFVELRRGKRPAEWPARRQLQASGYQLGLEALTSATSRDEENAARDVFMSADRPPPVRPLTFARERDARIVRKEPNAAISVVLNIVSARDAKAKSIQMSEGIDAATGKALKPHRSKTKIIVPLSCSKWHEQKFLGGKATLRSSMILRRGGRWFLQSQFEMAEARAVRAEGSLGIDRGLANTLVGAAVNMAGGVRALPIISGATVGDTIREIDRKDRAYKRRTGRVGLQHRRRVDHLLHDITNGIVAEARNRRLQVTMEDLSGFKQTIVQKRIKGARRNPWAKSLKKAQLGKIETLLEYKLALAGLPPLRKVPPGGTSITCTRCGHQAKENRPEQAVFRCVSCGFEAHADGNAAVQIARRGIMKVRKGDKLDALHRNMVAAFAGGGDGGLGPLAASAAGGFVAAHASAAGPNEGKAPEGVQPLSPIAGQELTDAAKNAREGVLAERGGSIFSERSSDNASDDNHLDES